jgi:hypothetical protein
LPYRRKRCRKRRWILPCPRRAALLRFDPQFNRYRKRWKE